MISGNFQPTLSFVRVDETIFSSSIIQPLFRPFIITIALVLHASKNSMRSWHTAPKYAKWGTPFVYFVTVLLYKKEEIGKTVRFCNSALSVIMGRIIIKLISGDHVTITWKSRDYSSHVVTWPQCDQQSIQFNYGTHHNSTSSIEESHHDRLTDTQWQRVLFRSIHFMSLPNSSKCSLIVLIGLLSSLFWISETCLFDGTLWFTYGNASNLRGLLSHFSKTDGARKIAIEGWISISTLFNALSTVALASWSVGTTHRWFLRGLIHS